MDIIVDTKEVAEKLQELKYIRLDFTAKLNRLTDIQEHILRGVVKKSDEKKIQELKRKLNM